MGWDDGLGVGTLVGSEVGSGMGAYVGSGAGTFVGSCVRSLEEFVLLGLHGPLSNIYATTPSEQEDPQPPAARKLHGS